MVEDTRLIELKGVTKSFGDTDALKSVNLYIRKKEFVTLLGPSGCGKTTMLRIIGGLRERILQRFRPTSAASIRFFRNTRCSLI